MCLFYVLNFVFKRFKHHFVMCGTVRQFSVFIGKIQDRLYLVVKNIPPDFILQFYMLALDY